MRKKLIGRLLVGSLLATSVIPLIGTTSVYAYENKVTKWLLTNDGWRYYNDDGTMVKNTTITLDSRQYKFDTNGICRESEENRKAAEEELDKNHKKMEEYYAKYAVTNEYSEDYKKKDDRWTNIDGKWHFDYKYPDCNHGEFEAINEWHWINGYWYHFDKLGVMERNTTIRDEGGNDCILNSDGILTNREQPEFSDDLNKNHRGYSMKNINGKTYFVNIDGKKATGWVKYSKDGKWYYANKDGVMQKDTTIIDGNKKYVLGSDGTWIQ